jgi:hypothetical protein
MVFLHILKGTNRDLQFTDDDINKLLNAKYAQGDTLVILSILYPWADLRHNFHVDHMYPKSSFTAKKLRARGVNEDKINDFIANYNYLANLQLLEEIPNIEKNAMDFEIWLKDKIPSGELAEYKKKHYIPDVGYDFNNFDVFFKEREKLLLKRLKSKLKMQM